jgi:hypothetical protein
MMRSSKLLVWGLLPLFLGLVACANGAGGGHDVGASIPEPCVDDTESTRPARNACRIDVSAWITEKDGKQVCEVSIPEGQRDLAFLFDSEGNSPFFIQWRLTDQTIADGFEFPRKKQAGMGAIFIKSESGEEGGPIPGDRQLVDGRRLRNGKVFQFKNLNSEAAEYSYGIEVLYSAKPAIPCLLDPYIRNVSRTLF